MHKAMAKSYFLDGPSKGDTLAALAAGLVESIRGAWTPELNRMSVVLHHTLPGQSMTARTSSVHVALSKSMARNQHVLSASIGYTPITCSPMRWLRYAASSAGRNFWFLHSPHFALGSSR